VGKSLGNFLGVRAAVFRRAFFELARADFHEVWRKARSWLPCPQAKVASSTGMMVRKGKRRGEERGRGEEGRENWGRWTKCNNRKHGSGTMHPIFALLRLLLILLPVLALKGPTFV
jgi:hypothetical protein